MAPNVTYSRLLGVALVLAVGHGFAPRGTSGLGRRRHSLGRGAALRAPAATDDAAAAEAEAAPAAAPTARPGRSWVKARPIGIGACAPDEIMTNVELGTLVDTSDEWIQTRTGISQRHLLPQGGQLRTLASTAAARALERAGVAAEDVDLVIVATSTPDDLFGDAPAVAHAIGATNAAAFDLTAACSGFLFALVTGSQFLHSGAYKTAVVVGGDALSRWVDWDDRNTCILFGDGAGAVVLQATDSTEESGVLGFELHSNGGDYRHLTLPFQGEETTLEPTAGSGAKYTVSKGKYAPVSMNGKEVYKFATREVPKVLFEALDNAGLTADDVDWLLLHQANIRIMETVATRLGIPFDRVITNIDEFANTSAGSIPLALEAAVASGKVKPGDIIACSGFGAGLNWGAAIIRWG